MNLLLFFIIGAIISVISGFFGVGGGFILTPLLMLLGFAPVEAITTSLLYTLGTSLSGIRTHIKYKNIDFKTGIIMGLCGVVATQIAKPFVLYLENRQLDETVIPIFYVILLGYFSFTMFKQGKKKTEATGEPVSNAIIKIIFIGFFAGFVSTTLGVGGGFLIVPLSVVLLGMTAKKAIGTSLFTIFLIVPVAFLSYIFVVDLDISICIALVLGSFVGATSGAKLTGYFQNKEISMLLSGMYIFTLFSVLLKIFQLENIGLAILGGYVLFFLIYAFLRQRNRKREKTA